MLALLCFLTINNISGKTINNTYNSKKDIIHILHKFIDSRFFKSCSDNIRRAKNGFLSPLAEFGPDITLQKKIDPKDGDERYSARTKFMLMSTKTPSNIRESYYEQAAEQLEAHEQRNAALREFLQLCVSLISAKKQYKILQNKHESAEAVYNLISGKVKIGEAPEQEEALALANLQQVKINIENNTEWTKTLVKSIFDLCDQKVAKSDIENMTFNIDFGEYKINKIIDNSLAIKRAKLEHKRRENQQYQYSIPEMDVSFDVEQSKPHRMPLQTESGFNFTLHLRSRDLHRGYVARLRSYNSAAQYRNRVVDTTQEAIKVQNDLNSVKREINILKSHSIPAADKVLQDSLQNYKIGQYSLEKLRGDYDKLYEYRSELSKKEDQNLELQIKMIYLTDRFQDIFHFDAIQSNFTSPKIVI